jgi:hypothetical protein
LEKNAVVVRGVRPYHGDTSDTARAGMGRLWWSGVQVIALLDCVHEVFGTAAAVEPPWFLLLELLEELQCVLGTPQQPQTPSRHRADSDQAESARRNADTALSDEHAVSVAAVDAEQLYTSSFSVQAAI